MIQSVFFFTMCLMIGEGDDRHSDCSYSWYLIENREIFNHFYEVFRTDFPKHIQVEQLMGFTVMSEKLIFVRDIQHEYSVLKHEAEHARCNLQFEGDAWEILYCNFLVDKPNLTRGSIMPDYGYVNPIPQPDYTEKIAFATYLIPPGVTQEYYDEQEAKNFSHLK